jgi:DNA-binding CsgD family transcriptional regulator
VTPLCDRLSPREEEVIVLLADDLGQREIALRLGIAEATVRSYRASARTKLGVQTTAAAVAIVVRARLVAVR